jgi:N-acetylglucosaminyldiphosphoundecaprenol N-acetyl-beta-D-mannosaminyltransferase
MWFAEIPITETQSFPPAAGPQCWVYVTLNAEIALQAPPTVALQRLLQQGRARVSVDGQWPWWALRRKYPQRPLVKLSGSQLIFTLAAHCAQRGQRLLLLGGSPEANGAAVARLQALHPGLRAAGSALTRYRLSGGAEEAGIEALALEEIRAFEPDYVVLGLGAAKEHRLALQLAPQLDARVSGLLAFGAAIDIASGRLSRAPRWVQDAGLEALYRVGKQPHRIPRLLRVLRILPRLLSGRY